MGIQEDIQEEVVHCPNCREEVPKTLYCLNCGHPLYKEVETMEEAPKVETEIKLEEYVEPTETCLESKAEEVGVFEPSMDEFSEEVKVDETFVQSPQIELNQMNLPESTEKEQEISPPLVEEEAPHETSLNEDAPLQQEIQAATTQEDAEEVQEEAEILEQVRDEACSEAVEEKPIEEIVQEPPKVEMEEESNFSEESLWKYDPDPLVQEILEHIARNLSLKVKLSKLLLDGTLKESTFLKLFEKYSAQGELWINRRNELIERNIYDIDSLEKVLEEAKIAKDELEIRKTIGDATDDEYLAKMPAYKWDISSLTKKIWKSKNEVEYLKNINHVLPAEDVKELRSLVDQCYESINNLGGSEVSDIVKSRVKEVLDEALDLIKGSS